MLGNRHTLLLILLEFFELSLAFSVACVLRFQGFELSEDAFTYLGKGLLIAAVVQAVFFANDLYGTKGVPGNWVLFRRFTVSMTIAVVGLLVVYYLLPQVVIGRGVFAITLGTFGGLFFVGRLSLRGVAAKWFERRYLIMGSGEFAKEVGRIIESRGDLGYSLLGYLDSRQDRVGAPFVGPGIVGVYDDVARIVKELSIDEIVVALSNRRGTMPVQDLLDLKFRGVLITDGMNFYEREFNRVYVRQLTPSWMIFSDGFVVSPLTRLTKRVLDVALSAIALVLVAPVMVAAGVLIRVTSSGPALYSQERVGRHGKPFTMWKFRSMRTDAEAAGPQFAQKEDPRITGVGRFIRKTRIDELPQLINILRGHMSLVGPRPERPVFVTRLEEKIPFYGQRHQVKPGLTGLAQISYGYSEGDEDHLHKLQYDLCYIKNLSVTLDLAIMAKTLKVVVLGTGAR